MANMEPVNRADLVFPVPAIMVGPEAHAASTQVSLQH